MYIYIYTYDYLSSLLSYLTTAYLLCYRLFVFPGADSWTIDDFITLFFRRCSRLGLKLVQIPEYFCGSNLQVHPYRAQPFIPPALPEAQMKALVRDLPAPSETLFSQAVSDFLDPKLRSLYLEKCVLFDRPHEWLRDDDRGTDWPAYLVDAAEEGAFSLTLGIAAAGGGGGVAAANSSASFSSSTVGTARSAGSIATMQSQAVSHGGGIGMAVGIVDPKAAASSTSSYLPGGRSSAHRSGASAGTTSATVPTTSSSSAATSTTTAPITPHPASLGRAAIPGRRAPAAAVPLDRQYMHRSGLACVRVAPSGGFVWLLNSSARVGGI
jgi:hypothetical protein